MSEDHSSLDPDDVPSELSSCADSRPPGRRESSSGRGSSPSRRARLDRLRRLTVRDHTLLDWLAEHYVLSTGQIAAAQFPALRAARLRLAVLDSLQAVSRFVAVTAGTRQYLYTLGPLGAVVCPTQYSDPNRADARAPRSSIERTERIIGSRKLAHLLGTNQLFIDLAAHARTDGNAELSRWWSEQHATSAYAAASFLGGHGSRIRPDGHGVWTVGDRQVGFFLEHDNGTEPLRVLFEKLRGYEQLAVSGGPRYPVLLRVPGRRREQHLLDALRGVPTAMPVATGIHSDHPAGQVWTLAADPATRRRLHELPSDHGPDDPATNPHRYRHPAPTEPDPEP